MIKPLLLEYKDFKQVTKPSRLYLMPLGGCGTFGMNMTCYIIDRKMIIVDAGSNFAEPWMVGVSFVIPNPNHWVFQKFDLLAYIITHAHEDHIGALPYFLKKRKSAIYASPWTVETIQRRFFEHNLDCPITPVEPGGTVTLEPFSVKFLKVGHSIPDACSLLIRAAGNTIFHSGDFKFDSKDGSPPPSLQSLKDESIDIALCDSTNADKDGFCPPEDSVGEAFRNIIKSTNKNVFITSFSSNLFRFTLIGEICKSLGKTLYVSGRSIRNNFILARRMNLIQDTYFSDDAEASAKTSNSVILISGCQGEYRSALARLANDEHRFFRIKKGDLVLFSSRAIPGNEKNIVEIINKLKRLKAKVLTGKDAPGIHVSGHAFGGEIETLAKHLKANYFIPIHGGFGHLLANQERHKGQKTLLIENGDLIEYDSKLAKINGTLKFDHAYIDELSSIPLAKSEVLEKIQIAKKGVATLSGVVSPEQRQWIRGPSLQFIGLPQDDAFLAKLTKGLTNALREEKKGNRADPDFLIKKLKALWESEVEIFVGKRPVFKAEIWLI
ncbi:MAG: ribonuclease J [Deltaproteobacteria bacterium]|nr:ribonuclease J [Deltaproteobacteria bacterium]